MHLPIRIDAVRSVVSAGSSSAMPSLFARYPAPAGRLAHSSACERICCAITSLPTESSRLSAYKETKEDEKGDPGWLLWEFEGAPPRAEDVAPLRRGVRFYFTPRGSRAQSREARDVGREFGCRFGTRPPLPVSSGSICVFCVLFGKTCFGSGSGKDGVAERNERRRKRGKGSRAAVLGIGRDTGMG
jgi:hypothetical protein